MRDLPVIILTDKPMLRYYLHGLTGELNMHKTSLTEYCQHPCQGNEFTFSVDFPDTFVSNQANLILLDYRLPPSGGLAVLENLKNLNITVPVLCLFRNLTPRNGVKAIKAGARGVIDVNVETDILKTALTHVSRGKTWYNDAIRYRLEDRDYELNPQKYRELTPRQKDTLFLIEKRMSNKEIGYALDMSLKTVERHKKDIADKFGLDSSRDIYDYALREGLFDSPLPKSMEEICT